jgi:uncharacterized repeat protein (TIGR01451 family)
MALVVVVVVAAVAVGLPGGSAPVGADGNEAPSAPAAFRQLSAGGSHTCAILAGGSVKCWGLNDKGQLGLGDTANRGVVAGQMAGNLPSVDLGTGRTAVAISAGTNHSCALLDNATVKCWGFNQTGELGIGDGGTRGDAAGEMGDNLPAVDLGTGRTAVAISAGQQYTCAVLDNATVKCWGSNFSGKLGQGDSANRGDAAGEMGDNLPAVDLGTGRTATAVAAGGFHTCVLLDNATMKCWGAGGAGALGQGSNATLGDGPNELGDDLPAIQLGTGRTATAITTGTDHTCALLDNGSVKCWGQSNLGQLGIGINTSVGGGPGQMGDSLPAVSLGTGRTAVAIRTKFNHTCAVLDNGSLKCWGWNVGGQLGIGDVDDRGEAPGEMGDALPAVDVGTNRTVVAVTTGITHTCARLDNGSLRCWGISNTGQLGLGDTQTRGDGPNEMGDNLPVTQLVTPAPAMTVGLTADETTVPVGTAIHFHVTVTNTGNVPLSSVTVTDAQVPGCAGPLADLAPGAATTVDCTHTPTVDEIGTFTNSAGADATEVAPVTSSAVNVAVTIPAGQALLKGRVTAVIFGNGVSGAMVAALSPVDFSMVGIDLTAANGNYAMLVPAGSCFAYVVDPAGGHIAAFASNSPTALADGQTVTLNAQVQRQLGGIEGRITDAGSGDGVPGAMALTTNLRTGHMSIGAAADSFGFWVVRNLRSERHLVALVDLSGAHRPEYYSNSLSPDGASPVNVVGGALQVIGTSTVDAQPAPSGTAHVQGTVTATGGAPIAGATVIALDASNYSFEAGDLTDGSGAYDIPVDPGSYIVGFLDPTGQTEFEWHADRSASQLAAATAVPAGVGSPAMVDATLTPVHGSVSGTITEDGTGDPLQGVLVSAIASSGAVVGAALTSPTGAYTLSTVPSGPVRIVVMDPTRGHVLEYFDDVTLAEGGYAAATVVTIAGGANQTVDAALAPSS